MNAFTDESPRQWLVDLLKTQDCNVRFTKANGEVREMFCTLRPEILGEDTRENTSSKPKSEHLAVWDLGNKAWRSFRFDSIISIDFNLSSH